MALAAFVAVAACFALPEAVYERITNGFGEGLNTIFAGRIDWLWIPLFPEVLKSPIYGSGLGSILWSAPMHAGGGTTVLAVTHPHNAYLEAALDLGIVGLLLVCAFFVWVLRGFFAMSKDLALSPTLRGFYAGAAAGLIALLISDIADSSLAPRPEQAFLWFAIGMMHGQRTK
jgi:O-antigen ligase